MTESDPDDDPQLRGLRSVWLSLPDDEPPQRGMAELMAAAREKAEQMARPSWWRRVLALLRRPPVLAIATVTVLVGGAVLIGRHRGEMEKAPAQAPAGSSAIAAPVAPASDVPVETTPEDVDLGRDRVATPPPAPPPPPPARKPPAQHLVPRPEGAKARLDYDSIDGFADDAKPAANRHSAEPKRADEESVAPKRKSAGGLVEQCRSAAARGDCAAVRACAARIAQQDSATYRDQIASDATISKCLAPE